MNEFTTEQHAIALQTMTHASTESIPEARTSEGVRVWRTSRNFLFWAVAWTLLGLGLASQSILVRPLLDGKVVTWNEAWPESLVFSTFWFLMSFVIFRMAKRYPLSRKNLVASVLRHMTLAAAIALLYVSICAFIPGVDNLIAANPTTIFEKFKTYMTLAFHAQVLFYVLVMLGCHAIEFYGRLRDKELTASQLRAELANAHLNELKSQLNPHFLFNTLSAITTFIHEDPALAETMTVRLSQLLRMSLESGNTHKRLLSDELEFLQLYVEIQTMRFGERVNYQQQIEPGAASALVPTLILQPLVENAFKHGVGQSTQCCNVRVGAKVGGRKLILEVIDDGPGPTDDLTFGIGLENTVARLEQLYGSEHSFVIDRSNGFRIQITLPLESDLT